MDFQGTLWQDIDRRPTTWGRAGSTEEHSGELQAEVPSTSINRWQKHNWRTRTRTSCLTRQLRLPRLTLEVGDQAP